LNCDDLPRQKQAGEQPEPCNKCVSCTNITSGKDTNVLEIDASSNRGIDNAKQLTGIANQQSPPGKWQIVILDEAHGLTKDAQNALLALFESPPSAFLPILCTTEVDKILPTILSRCSQFSVRALSNKAICENLSRIFSDAGVTVTPESLFSIARIGNGSLRDVQQLADQVINSVVQDEVVDEEFLESVIGIPTSLSYRAVAGALNSAWVNGPTVWFTMCEELANAGADFSQLFFQVLSTVLRDFRVGVESKGLAAPVVPYWSGISHEVFQSKLSLNHDDLDILNQSWDDSVKQFELQTRLGPRPAFEFFFLRAWDFKRAKVV
jgi:DNA polymerase III subunit gamma/tau